MKLIGKLAIRMVGKVFSGLRPSMDPIGRFLVKTFRSHIDAGRSESGSMSPLSAAYSLQKQRRHGFTHPILKATGEFYKSIKYRVTKG